MKNMRQRPRVEINHMVTYTCHNGSDEYGSTNSGRLLNISTNGALMESHQPFTGKLMVLGNNSQTNPRMVKGEIVYEETVITPEGNVSGLYRAGIKFTDLHENSKEFVVSIVQPDSINGAADGNDEVHENILNFDVDSINQILTDDTPTEDLILIEELLEDDAGVDVDVLEDISIVLKETQAPGLAANNIEAKKETSEKKSADNLNPDTVEESEFLSSFNSICLSVACFMFATLLILKLTSILPDSFTFLPFNNKLVPVLVSEDDEILSSKNVINSNEKSISLINSSIKSRFIHTEDNSYQFVINGLINKTSKIRPEDIQVTAKIFGNTDSLLGQVSIIAANAGTGNAAIGINKEEQVIPFIIKFPNPPEEISRFSLDLRI